MDTKLYYTKEELMAKPHFNFVDNGKDLYLHQKDGEFEIFKKIKKFHILRNKEKQ